jgi:hypothetical protein
MFGMEINKDILNFFILISVFLVGCCGYVYFHESAHANIFRYFGVNSHTEVYAFGLGGGMTFPVDTNLSKADYIALYSAQSNVEAIGYQLFPLVCMICGVLIVGFMYVGYKIGEIER